MFEKYSICYAVCGFLNCFNFSRYASIFVSKHFFSGCGRIARPLSIIPINRTTWQQVRRSVPGGHSLHPERPAEHDQGTVLGGPRPSRKTADTGNLGNEAVNPSSLASRQHAKTCIVSGMPRPRRWSISRLSTVAAGRLEAAGINR